MRVVVATVLGCAFAFALVAPPAAARSATATMGVSLTIPPPGCTVTSAAPGRGQAHVDCGGSNAATGGTNSQGAPPIASLRREVQPDGRILLIMEY